MKKRFIFSVLMLLAVFTLVACKDAEGELSAITFDGVEDVTLDFEAEFNVMDGVKATGNNGVDYTDSITYSHVARTIITDDVLDTTVTGQHAIKYEVEVEGILAQVFRMVTVKEPAAIEGQLLVNPDFSLGTAGWDNSAKYEAEGGTIALSTEDGALKAEVVAGPHAYTPRFGQMNVAFEQGKTYEVAFRAKSSVEKTINLQVGELIDVDPWFIDFKTGVVVHKTITTEWDTYSYKFTMTQDNPRGGILFELGKVGDDRIDATLWFDDVSITETTPDADETAPLLSGVRANVSIPINDSFDPLSGITAMDNLDGEITDNIVLEIYLVEDEDETLVTAVDTSAEGTYRLVYTISDEAGNITTAESNVKVVVLNPDLYELPEYRTFLNSWEGTVGMIQGLNGQLLLTLSNINTWENWQIQIIQDAYALGTGEDNEGSMQFEADKTYRVSFDAKSTTAGDITVAIGHAGGGWTPYHEEIVSVTNDMDTYTFTFTTDDAEADYSVLAQFKLEMGLLYSGLTTEQTFVLDNLIIEVLEGEDYVDAEMIVNGTMEAPVPYNLSQYRTFLNDWEGTAGMIQGINGELVLTLTNVNTWENWQIQVIQDAFALGTGEDNEGSMQFEADKTYRVSFDAKSTTAGDITVAIGHAGGGWTPYHAEVVSVTNDMDTYTFTFTTDDAEADYSVLAQFKLEMGLLFAGSSLEQKFVLDNLTIEVLDGEDYIDAGLIVNGTMEAPEPYTLEQYRAFLNDWEGTAGMIYGLEGELLLTLTNVNTWENWQIQIIQDAYALGTGEDNEGSMQFEADKTYRVSFDAKSTTAGDITVAIGHAGGDWTPYHAEVVAVTNDMDTYTFTFTTDDAEADYSVLAQFKLEMGLLFSGALGTQTFVLDNLTIEVLDGEDYIDAGLVVNGEMEEAVSE